MGWTGSKQFEKDIRRLATEHGYSVSLFDRWWSFNLFRGDSHRLKPFSNPASTVFQFSYTGLTIAKSGFVVSTPTEREM